MTLTTFTLLYQKFEGNMFCDLYFSFQILIANGLILFITYPIMKIKLSEFTISGQQKWTDLLADWFFTCSRINYLRALFLR